MAPSQHLCYFIDTVAVGGAERYLVDMVRGMQSRGYRVTVVCHRFSGLLESLEKQTQCQVISRRLPSITRNRAIQGGLAVNRSARGAFNLLKIPGLLLYYWNTLVCFLKLWPVFKELRPDILHVSAGGYPAGESHRAAILAGYLQRIARRVLTIHSHVLPPPIPYPERWIDRFVENSLHAVITASQESKESLIENRGFRAKTVRVIYCGVDTQTATTNDDARALRRELGVPEQGILIGAIGALDPGKGYATLIEAVSLLAKGTPCSLAILGSGPNQAALQNQIKTLGLLDRVFLLGYREKAQRFIRAFSYVGFSSNRYECVPYTIKDAMLAGVPVVSTDVGGTGEAVRNDETGLLVPRDNPPAMAAAFRRLMTDASLGPRLAKNAEDRVRHLFSLNDMILMTAMTYQDS